MKNNSNMEVELKFKLGNLNLQEMETMLVQKGYEKSDRVYEQTVMYDNEAQIMQITDGRLRLRTSIANNEEKVKLSYKKPITREGIKKEIEYEVKTSSREQTELIIKEMGFSRTTSYERYRTTFENNEIELTVDEFPFATFVEIEGEEEKIIELAKELGLNIKENITDSCDTLFTKWRKEKGLPMTNHMLFDSYDK